MTVPEEPDIQFCVGARLQDDAKLRTCCAVSRMFFTAPPTGLPPANAAVSFVGLSSWERQEALSASHACHVKRQHVNPACNCAQEQVLSVSKTGSKTAAEQAAVWGARRS